MRVIFTVTNDLSYDQRMHRICSTLAGNGYSVTLVGRKLPESIPLEPQVYMQERLRSFFQKGFLFYAEYNLRLCLFLLFTPFDAVCSIDLDTLSAGCFATLIRRKKRVFDAHEYFTEVPEVVHRSIVKHFWGLVARICLPFYRHAYTVGPALAEIFEAKYGLKFEVVRNVPAILKAADTFPAPSHVVKGVQLPSKWGSRGGLLYQGALNEGRGIETLLEAMQYLENAQLVLAGEGDLSVQLRQKARDLGLQDRVVFLGYVKPEDLKQLTAQAWLSLNLLENRGLSYFYSLANKFFDSVQACVPVLTMDFPEYHALNAQYEVAVLLEELSPESVAQAINSLLEDQEKYKKLQQNCRLAREEWNWELEQKTLLNLWRQVEQD